MNPKNAFTNSVMYEDETYDDYRSRRSKGRSRRLARYRGLGRSRRYANLRRSRLRPKRMPTRRVHAVSTRFKRPKLKVLKQQVRPSVPPKYKLKKHIYPKTVYPIRRYKKPKAIRPVQPQRRSVVRRPTSPLFASKFKRKPFRALPKVRVKPQVKPRGIKVSKPKSVLRRPQLPRKGFVPLKPVVKPRVVQGVLQPKVKIKQQQGSLVAPSPVKATVPKSLKWAAVAIAIGLFGFGVYKLHNYRKTRSGLQEGETAQV